MVYTSDPWAVINSALAETNVAQPELHAAQSFVEQAKEYHRAADAARSTEAQPLLYYYGFLNLGKALAIARGRNDLVGRVEHGLSVDDLFANTPQGEVIAHPTRTQRKIGKHQITVISAADDEAVVISAATAEATTAVSTTTPRESVGMCAAETSRSSVLSVALTHLGRSVPKTSTEPWSMHSDQS